MQPSNNLFDADSQQRRDPLVQTPADKESCGGTTHISWDARSELKSARRGGERQEH
jgi:hypothetical protein